MSNLKMTLLENSISFFMESITKAVQAEKDADKWKFAILLLVQAIETSLKERLRRTQEVLVYTNIDKPKHTFDLHLVINKLENISKVAFNTSDLTCIKLASDLRNKIVNFEFNLSIDQIKSNFVNLVGFYTSFCRDQLETDIVNIVPSNLHKELLGLDSYVDELEKRAEERIKKEGIGIDEIWMCPVCSRDTFIIDDAQDVCYLCPYQEDIIECEKCKTLEFDSDMGEVDFGNMKGIENWKRICKDCINRMDDEAQYHDYY